MRFSFPSLLLAKIIGVSLAFSTAYGQSPATAVFSTSDPLSIQRGIKAAYQSGQHRVVIPPGVYPVEAEAHAGSHLYFSGMKDFEIDATGVTFIFNAREKSSIDFHDCTDVTLRGATLLRQTLPFSQGRVTDIGPDRQTMTVQVSAGYPTEFDDPRYFAKLWFNRYDPSTRRWQEDMSPKTGSLQRTGPDTFQCRLNRPLAAEWKIGTALAWRGNGASDIGLVGCARMKILDVTIKGGIGFCVHESGGAGGNYYRYTVTYSDPPPGAKEEPLMASNADGFHSDGVRLGPTLEDCHFEGMDDDGIPIHGQYALVRESQGSQLVIEARNPPFCLVGDHLRFLDSNEALAGEAQVVSVERLPTYQPAAPPPKELRLFKDETKNKYERLTLDHPVNTAFGCLVSNADANGAGFVVRRCTIRNNRARGMLIKASNGLIEDCTVEGSSMGGIVIAPEPEFWNESDYAQNVIVRHNVVRDCDYWSQPGTSQAGSITLSASVRGKFVPLPGGHRHIVIEDNSFEDNDGVNLLISSAQDVVVKDNRFIHAMQHFNDRGKALGITPGSLIYLTEASRVQVSGNQVEQPGPFLLKKVDATSTASGTGLQDGFAPPPPKVP